RDFARCGCGGQSPPSPGTSGTSVPLLAGLVLRLLAVLDDVAGLEEDALDDLAEDRLAAEQELEVHAEVLELLLLRVLHDRARLAVALDREPLLVPADRLGLLDQRRADARESARLLGQLARRLVVLVERHGAPYTRRTSARTRGAPIPTRSCSAAWR